MANIEYFLGLFNSSTEDIPPPVSLAQMTASIRAAALALGPLPEVTASPAAHQAIVADAAWRKKAKTAHFSSEPYGVPAGIVARLQRTEAVMRALGTGSRYAYHISRETVYTCEEVEEALDLVKQSGAVAQRPDMRWFRVHR